MRKVLFTALSALVLLLVGVGSALAQGGNVHYVQRGESLSTIAANYGVTSQALMVANGLQNPDFIYVGQKLTIPTAGHSGSANNNTGYYTVRAGDTLNNIAQRLNTTVKALFIANNLSNSDVIYVGQVLNVPGMNNYVSKSPPPNYSNPSYTCRGYYTVQWGDTLSDLAWQHGTTTNAILGANHLNSDAIHEGQKLCLPGGGSAGGAE